MNQQTLSTVLSRAFWVLKNSSPFRTGNLRYNAIKLESLGRNEWRIFVDEKIAPYMPFTNEKWVSEKWHGKQNPNEGWFDNGVEKIVNYIAYSLSAVRIERS